MVLVKLAVMGIMLKSSILGGVDMVANATPHFEKAASSKHKVVRLADDMPIECGYYHTANGYTWYDDNPSGEITLDMIGEHNYDMWVKKYPDSYGFNKGECNTPYKKGEEKFYNDYYDHWNVDKVYDEGWLKHGNGERPTEEETEM